MENPTITAEEYWGYLIKADKTPTPLCEQLLLGIANYIKREIAPWDVHCLTPTKLAAFYRHVGGDCDALFLKTPPPSLSFIYQCLGCFHTLQPDHDPWVSPSIPALTPQGFVRWQTVQLLLGPEEHVPFLQKAVKSFAIIHLADGSEFPKVLPKTAFPAQPDWEMLKWHDGVQEKLVAEKLRVEAEASTSRTVPETTVRRDHDMDVDCSTTQSSIEDQSVVDAAEYFSEPRFSSPFVRPNIGVVHMPAPPHTHPPRQQQWLAPNSHHHRRRSLPDNNQRRNQYWSTDAPTPTQATAPHPRPHSRPTTPGTLSTTSSSSSSDDESSPTASEASGSPIVRYQDRYHLSAPSSGQERRHSAHSPYGPRDFATPQPAGAAPRAQQSYFDQDRTPAGPPRGTARGLNVRWRDANHIWDLPGSAPATLGGHHSARRREGRGDSSGGHSGSRRVRGPLRGVGGRRYPTDGLSWV
ncbi:hypothetical protein LPUS_01148 [Lasallia pustulata]|uniref:DUF7514 domain-containing protein n=1 Tax=Lasallia pustulata TaxID=136370 RepID=A0A1W5D839_9LECA|nr:hypothetical protein LPUS_01148 [Lasallia pustulata]